MGEIEIVRRMSFSMTTPQMRARTKTVTRRRGWSFLKPGDRLLAIEKGQGLKKGERQVPIGVIEVVSVRRVVLALPTHGDAKREGFPGMRWSDFVAMFCKANRCEPTARVNRIEFRHMTARPRSVLAMLRARRLGAFGRQIERIP